MTFFHVICQRKCLWLFEGRRCFQRSCLLRSQSWGGSPRTLCFPKAGGELGVVTLGQGVLGPSPLPVGQRVTAGTPEGNLRKPGEMPAGWREAPGGARGAGSCGNQSEETNLSGRLRGCRARTKGPTRAG